MLESILQNKRQELARLQRQQLSDKMENMRPITVMRKLGEYCQHADKDQLELLKKILQHSNKK